LPAETRRNIYLFCKEAINNLVKHSGASALDFLVSEEKNSLQITIADNGCGFDAAKAINGNGLANMQKRADQINALLSVESANGQGTTLKIIVKIPSA